MYIIEVFVQVQLCTINSVLHLILPVPQCDANLRNCENKHSLIRLCACFNTQNIAYKYTIFPRVNEDNGRKTLIIATTECDPPC